MRIDPNPIPGVWKDVITMLAQRGIPSVVAGGAVRDWRLSREVKDIDLWVAAHTADEFKDVLSKVRGAFGEPIKVFAPATEYREWNWEFLGYETYELGHEIIQVVGVDLGRPVPVPFSPAAVVDRFDFGICQAAYDGYTTFFTPAFENDVTNMEFTLLRGSTHKQLELSVARFVRLEAKYHGWKFRVAPGVAIAAAERDNFDELV